MAEQDESTPFVAPAAAQNAVHSASDPSKATSAAAAGQPQRQPLVQPVLPVRPVRAQQAREQHPFPVSGYGNRHRAKQIKDRQVHSTPSAVQTRRPEIIGAVQPKPIINAVPHEAVAREQIPVGADEK